MYYALEDLQNGRQLMHTGRNTTSKQELKDQLLEYISADFDELDDRGAIQEYTVEALAEWWQFEIVTSTKKFWEGFYE